MARMIRTARRAAPATVALATTPEDEAFYAQAKAEAERKMAIVDALGSGSRAIVHEIGLRDFKNKDKHCKGSYERAKARAGVVGHTRSTQKVGKGNRLPGVAAAAVQATY